MVCADSILGLMIALMRDVLAGAFLRIFGAPTDIFGAFRCLTVYLIGWHSGARAAAPWNSPYIWGTVALVLTYSAYVAEIFRAA